MIRTDSLPVEPNELEALLCATPSAEWEELRNRLAAQLGDVDQAWQLLTDASRTIEHERDIDRQQRQLALALRTAREELARAETVFDALDSPPEGPEGLAISAEDFRAVLAQAARTARLADALAPTPDSP